MVLSPRELHCAGCGTPFEYDESGVMIFDKPYCNEDCYIATLTITEFVTESEPTEEDRAQELLRSYQLSPMMKSLLRQFAEIYEIDVSRLEELS